MSREVHWYGIPLRDIREYFLDENETRLFCHIAKNDKGEMCLWFMGKKKVVSSGDKDK